MDDHSFEARIIKMLHVKKDEDIYHDSGTTIEIVDEGGGEYLEISQDSDSIRIEPEEWGSLKAAIDKMINQCRPIDNE